MQWTNTDDAEHRKMRTLLHAQCVQLTRQQRQVFQDLIQNEDTKERPRERRRLLNECGKLQAEFLRKVGELKALGNRKTGT